MKNVATKKDAVRVINTAVKEGWSRQIDIMRDCQNKPWSVQVSLQKTVYFKNGYMNISSHVIVSFRKTTKRGWVISIAVPSHSKTFRGIWNADYALRQMRETCARQIERDTQKTEAA